MGNISTDMIKGSEIIRQTIKEMELLANEITDKEQCILEMNVEKSQQMRNELKDSKTADDLVTFLVRINVLRIIIQKWVEQYESLKGDVCRWKEKKYSVEDAMNDLAENMRLQDQKASDIEENISFLNLMIKFEGKMKNHKENINRVRDFNSFRTQQKEHMLKCVHDQMKEMDDRRQIFVKRYNTTEEEYRKIGRRIMANCNFENENINPCIEDIRHTLRGIEEFESKSQQDRVEITNVKNTLEMFNLEIEKKCKEEISYPEDEYLSQEHTLKLQDLCSELDKWSKEYECFEVEHDQWIKEKSKLKETMKSAEECTALYEEKIGNIDQSITCLKKMIDTEEIIKEQRNNLAILADLQKLKKVTDRRWEQFVKQIPEQEENRMRLEEIKKNWRK